MRLMCEKEAWTLFLSMPVAAVSVILSQGHDAAVTIILNQGDVASVSVNLSDGGVSGVPSSTSEGDATLNINHSEEFIVSVPVRPSYINIKSNLNQLQTILFYMQVPMQHNTDNNNKNKYMRKTVYILRVI